MVKDMKGLIIILLFTVLISGAQGATLHGTIYEWSDFEKPLKSAIIEVNSTPAQYMISTAGTYSFNLSPGNYLIKAKYYRNNVLEYITEEDIRIDREGDFVHDLLLFPPTDLEYEYLGDINLTNELSVKNESNLNTYIIFILTIILSGLIIFYRIKKIKSVLNEPIINEPMIQPPENVTETKTRPLPEDLHTLYDMILKTGGRTTQKELRKKIPYSEAKISLMLDDLEDRGFVKKIKKGRSNIVIAEFLK